MCRFGMLIDDPVASRRAAVAAPVVDLRFVRELERLIHQARIVARRVGGLM